jgi:hypothetical protein
MQTSLFSSAQLWSVNTSFAAKIAVFWRENSQELILSCMDVVMPSVPLIVVTQHNHQALKKNDRRMCTGR